MAVTENISVRIRDGYTQIWFWQGQAAAEFESSPIKIQNFQEEVTHSCTFEPILCQFFNKVTQFEMIFLSLNQLWVKLRKMLKNCIASL